MREFLSTSTWVVLLSALLLSAGARADQVSKITEPQLADGEQIVVMSFGDDQTVALLAGVAAEVDPLARAWAVTDLGRTHNRAALPHIRKALSDPDASIRTAAVIAAAELGIDSANSLVVDALADGDTSVLLAALQAAVKSSLTKAHGKIIPLLDSADALVRAEALRTLTALSLPAGQDKLKSLIADPATRVRVAALANALLLDSADSLVEQLTAAAGPTNTAAVRSAAAEALGKFAFTTSAGLLGSAAKDKHPLVRRGAARGYHHAGKGNLAGRFLDDASPMVRLAAIRAAGDLQLSDHVDKLMRLMFEAPDAGTHLAARTALGQIGTPAVAAAAAKNMVHLRELRIPKPKPPQAKPTAAAAPADKAPDSAVKILKVDGMRVEHIDRNVAGCCWLLGHLKSTDGLDYQLAMMPRLSAESEILLELVPALGKIGQKKATAPLLALLERSHVKGIAYLRAIAARSSTLPPYEPGVPVRIMKTLSELGATEAFEPVLKVANTNIKELRLARCAAQAVLYLPSLTTDGNRTKMESFLVEVIADSRFGLTARFHAAKAAGRAKLQTALPGLDNMLNQQRRDKRMIRTAGWAIQEITGTTPPLPQPRLNTPGAWVISKLR